MLTEVEAILISWPITPLLDYPHDVSVLTPLLLIGGPLLSAPNEYLQVLAAGLELMD